MLRHRFHPKSSRFFCGGGAQDLDHPVVYLIGKKFGGHNCRKFRLVPKILTAENFCPPKMFLENSRKIVAHCIITL